MNKSEKQKATHQADGLQARMKGYENASRIYLTKRMPVIIRIDGKAFHSFTRNLKKPFDPILMTAMQKTAEYLCENIMGCKLAYTQSDEISLLLVNYERNESEAWFNNNLQKLVSVAASMATLAFSNFFEDQYNLYEQCFFESEALFDCNSVAWSYREVLIKACGEGAMFDARAFVLPRAEVCNYFIWRQQDAVCNSIQMVAQSLFTDEQIHNKSNNELQEMMFQDKGVNWNDLDVQCKRGSCCIKTKCPSEDGIKLKWHTDALIPIFTKDRSYIERWVYVNV